MDSREKIEYLLNCYKGEHPDAVNQLTEWRNKLIQLDLDKSFFEHEKTKEIVKEMTKRIDEIGYILSNAEELEEVERKLLFRERKVYKQLLSDIGVSDEILKEIDYVKEQIDEEHKAVTEEQENI